MAVPKGLPERPGLKRLAVQVDDHELEFGQFEGMIGKGEYGAGRINILDHDTYELEEWTQRSHHFYAAWLARRWPFYPVAPQNERSTQLASDQTA